jgi:hypothetical protein
VIARLINDKATLTGDGDGHISLVMPPEYMSAFHPDLR